MLGGAVALVGIVLLLNWNLPYTAPGGRLHAPDPPTVRPLHEGIVEVDWNDIAGADRYALQFWRPTGWTDTTDPELGTSESLDGSRAIIGNLPNGTVFDTFRVRAGACGRWSDWSIAGRHLSTHSMDWQGYPLPALGPATDRDAELNVIWSADLSVGTSQRQPHDIGYSFDDHVGLLSPNEFTLDGARYKVLRAFQREDSFFVDLQGQADSRFEFTLSIEDLRGERVAEFSSCDSIRLKGSSGERLLWLGADTLWTPGTLATLSISRGLPESRPQPDTLLWPIPRLTAEFERMPERHSGAEFSVNVRFSESVSVSEDSLQVTSGTVTSLAPVDGRTNLWEVRVAPDDRRSVRIRLLDAPTCTGVGAICTQHNRRLTHHPETLIPGPAVTARFLEVPEYHSGLDNVRFLIEFSEPLFASMRGLRDRAFDVVGGHVTSVRRVDARHDLWEVTAIADSSDPLHITLNPRGGCTGLLSGCPDDLHRIADSQQLTIPPAKLHLTFDDGPHPVYTPQILDILARYQARATFFVIGQLAAYYPDLIQRIIDEGHTLANHTWTHDILPNLTMEEFEQTIRRTAAVLGEHATPCLRPPNYMIDSHTLEQLQGLGIRLIMGTVRSGDWSRPGADVIVWRILQGAAPDAVVVLHDGGGDRSQTVEALGSILNQLQSQNYSYEPVCE